MPERQRRPDLDEQFSLHPEEAEDVLRKLLRADDDPDEEPPPDSSET